MCRWSCSSCLGVFVPRLLQFGCLWIGILTGLGVSSLACVLLRETVSNWSTDCFLYKRAALVCLLLIGIMMVEGCNAPETGCYE